MSGVDAVSAATRTWRGFRTQAAQQLFESAWMLAGGQPLMRDMLLAIEAEAVVTAHDALVTALERVLALFEGSYTAQESREAIEQAASLLRDLDAASQQEEAE